MAKYDKRFTLKCDQDFKDDLELLSIHNDLTMAEVVRVVISIAAEGLR